MIFNLRQALFAARWELRNLHGATEHAREALRSRPADDQANQKPAPVHFPAAAASLNVQDTDIGPGA
jgi:hypothetical protein